MSNQHPFSEPDPFVSQGPARPPRQRNAGPLAILGIVIFVGLMLCGGIVVISYVAIQRAAGIGNGVPLDDDWETVADDRATFNQSLANFVADPTRDPCIDPEICEYVKSSLDLLRDYESIPFSREMFVSAVAMSPAGQGQIGLVDRLTINSWIMEYEPVPPINEPFERILDVRLNNDETLATVDLLLYSDDERPLTQQWYLVKEDNRWKLYDWHRLDYGRRMSDEYAGYVIAETPDAEGYDDVLDKLDEAIDEWYDDSEAIARLKIRRCETKPMLAADRHEGKLRIAETWMTIEEFESAVRVLKSIRNPEESWGVWSTLANCYLRLGRSDDALQAAREAERQSPNHPMVHALYSNIYEELKRESESAHHAALALQLCPRDSGYLAAVVDHERLQDIPLVLSSVLSSEDYYDWSNVLDTAATSTTWGEELVKVSEQSEDSPSGFSTLALANKHWSLGEFDTAAELFLKAKDEVDLPVLRSIATADHIDARIRSGNINALIAEAGDSNALPNLMRDALSEELAVEPSDLLLAIEQADVSDFIWAVGLRGYAHHQLNQFEPAFNDLDAFHEWAKSEIASETEEASEVAPWMLETVASYMTTELVMLGRSMDVLERWPGDTRVLDAWGEMLAEQRHAEERQRVLTEIPVAADGLLQVQRLRMLASDARANGQAKDCDQFHREALQIAYPFLVDDYRYAISNMVRQRAQDAVWTRLDELKMLESENLAGYDPALMEDRFFVDGLREALRLYDLPTALKWIDQAGRNGSQLGETDGMLLELLANLYSDLGKYSEAADYFLEAIQNSAENDGFRREDRGHYLVSARLNAGQVDELRSWIQSLDDPPVWYEASIALSARDGTKLKDLLIEQEGGDVRRWLSRAEQRELLDRHADDTLTSELLERYVLSRGYRYPVSTGTVLLDRDALPADDEMMQLVQLAVGDESTVSRIRSDSDQHSWVALDQDGNRVVISLRLTNERFGGAPNLVRDRIGEALAVVIQIDDQNPRVTRRLFEAAQRLAQRLAQRDAIGFYWNNHQVLWLGDDLAARLTWQDRVPIETSDMQLWLQWRENADRESGNMTLEEWEEALRASETGSIPVFVRQWCAGTYEKLPGKLVAVNADRYHLRIELEADGVLDPLAKKGRSFGFRVGNVEKRPQ